jgi:hypothetical protein|tara:strand:- start:713 stop:946 length:234 start_codon:yes stop_codon:yes gene_type:complete
MHKRKLCEYQLLIEEIASAIFENYGSIINNCCSNCNNEETSQAILEEIEEKTGWLYSELTADILKEINEINMITVQP